MKKELVEACHYLGLKGFFPGSSGNATLLDRDKKHIYVTATGRRKSDLKETDVLVLDLDGNVIEGSGKPSKEVNLHQGIYRIRKDVSAVIHHHSPYATAFALAGRAFPLLTTPAKMRIRIVPLVKQAPPGSIELAELVTGAFSDGTVKASLLRDHGTVCVGEDMEDAIKISEWLEDAAFHAYLSSHLNQLS